MNKLGISKSVALLAIASATLLTGCKKEDLDSLLGKAEEQEISQPSNDNNSPPNQALPTQVDLKILKDREFSLECVLTGNAQQDQLCEKDMIQDRIDGDNSIYFRVMDATKNGKATNGLGVWASRTAFENCGGIDLTDSDKYKIENQQEPFIFANGGVVTGPAFSVDEVLCPVRNEVREMDHKNIRLYFTAGEVQVLDGYTILEAHDHWTSGNCEQDHTTLVRFITGFDSAIYAQVSSHEVRYGNCGGDNQITSKDFLVRLTPR